MSTLSIQKYTPKSIVVRGDTKAHLPLLKSFAPMGKFGYFGGEPGWVFPLTMEAKVRAQLGIHTPYVDGPKAPTEEEKAAKRAEYQKTQTANNSNQPGSVADLLLKRTETQVTSAVSYKTPAVAAMPSGALRGPPPEDDDSPQVPDELVAMKQRLAELEQRVAVLEARAAGPSPASSALP